MVLRCYQHPLSRSRLHFSTFHFSKAFVLHCRCGLRVPLNELMAVYCLLAGPLKLRSAIRSGHRLAFFFRNAVPTKLTESLNFNNFAVSTTIMMIVFSWFFCVFFVFLPCQCIAMHVGSYPSTAYPVYGWFWPQWGSGLCSTGSGDRHRMEHGKDVLNQLKHPNLLHETGHRISMMSYICT